MTSDELRTKLVHAATAYDRKQERRPHYNPHALGMYLGRIDEVVADVERGTPVADALARGFNGALQRALCRAVGAAASDDHGRQWYYEPVRDN